MACCCGDFVSTAEQQFTAKKAAAELQQYRRKGAGSTTRLLREGLAKAGLISGTVLDIGAGIGALTFELLDRGISSALIVDASPAYMRAAAEEAVRRGRASAIQFVHGDFLSVKEQVRDADVVTLDRVVCCYPSYQSLLEHAVRHANKGFALSYPRDRWFVRVVVCLENAIKRRPAGFRTFVHPPVGMQQIIEQAGFTLVSRRGNLVWSADVFVKQPSV
jgi:magnesium-protoporphyrin O-methyltransferase